MKKSTSKIERLKTAGKARSPHWRSVEKKIIAAHPFCAACGGKTHLVGHHVQPFHLFPELELEPSNIIILCESRGKRACHFLFGHFFDWKNFNPKVVEMAAEYRAAMLAATL